MEGVGLGVTIPVTIDPVKGSSDLWRSICCNYVLALISGFVFVVSHSPIYGGATVAFGVTAALLTRRNLRRAYSSGATACGESIKLLLEEHTDNVRVRLV